LKFTKLELCLTILNIISKKHLTFNQIDKKLLVRRREVEESLKFLVKNQLVRESPGNLETAIYSLTQKGANLLDYFEKKPVVRSFDNP
jgi:predicted transcriptional regulator